MRKAKLNIYSIDRIQRQAVDELLEQSIDAADVTGARGAIVILTTAKGRTLVKGAGQLRQENAMIAELFRAAVRTADNE